MKDLFNIQTQDFFGNFHTNTEYIFEIITKEYHQIKKNPKHERHPLQNLQIFFIQIFY